MYCFYFSVFSRTLSYIDLFFIWRLHFHLESCSRKSSLFEQCIVILSDLLVDDITFCVNTLFKRGSHLSLKIHIIILNNTINKCSDQWRSYYPLLGFVKKNWTLHTLCLYKREKIEQRGKVALKVNIEFFLKINCEKNKCCLVTYFGFGQFCWFYTTDCL